VKRQARSSSMALFHNTYQSGFLTIFYAIGSKPLQIWDKQGGRLVTCAGQQQHQPLGLHCTGRARPAARRSDARVLQRRAARIHTHAASRPPAWHTQ
jgi:hypothetical protein